MRNNTAKLLKNLSWGTLVGGIISSFWVSIVQVPEIIGSYVYTETSFSFNIFLAVISSSIVSFALFRGFAEIIELLDSIHSNQKLNYSEIFNANNLDILNNSSKTNSTVISNNLSNTNNSNTIDKPNTTEIKRKEDTYNTVF